VTVSTISLLAKDFIHNQILEVDGLGKKLSFRSEIHSHAHNPGLAYQQDCIDYVNMHKS